MNWSERVAKEVVEFILKGTTMHYRTSQSSGEYDFDLEYPDGTKVPMEVTMATDKQMRGTIDAITSENRGGSFVEAKLCRNGWRVHPLRNANITRIRAEVDTYLANIEAANLDRFFAWTDAASSEPVAAILKDLKIESGSVFSWKDGCKINIAMPGQESLVTSEDAQLAIKKEACKADNRRKLGGTEYNESHLFIYVDPINYSAWISLVDTKPPAEPPALPVEITHIWVVTETRTSNVFVVWRAALNSVWEAPALIPITLPLC